MVCSPAPRTDIRVAAPSRPDVFPAIRLRGDSAHFDDVDYPAADPFFAEHGLLYLDHEDLADLSERLAAAQPLLAVLAADPTLRGLAEFLHFGLVQGDANANPDPMLATPAELLGRVALSVPLAGVLMYFLGEPAGIVAVLSFMGSLLLARWNIDDLLKGRRPTSFPSAPEAAVPALG